eukprot:3800972-Pleurochrysis_carterae.AAC.1
MPSGRPGLARPPAPWPLPSCLAALPAARVAFYAHFELSTHNPNSESEEVCIMQLLYRGGGKCI